MRIDVFLLSRSTQKGGTKEYHFFNATHEHKQASKEKKCGHLYLFNDLLDLVDTRQNLLIEKDMIELLVRNVLKIKI